MGAAPTEMTQGAPGRRDRTPEEILADIEHTRSAMGETLNALQTRLNPRNLRQQAQERVREATIGRAKDMAENVRDRAKGAGTTLMDTIRHNPVPAALVAVGLGWLVMSSRSEPSYPRTETYRTRGEYMPPVRERPTVVSVGAPREEEGGMRERVADVAGEARERVTGMAEEARDRVSEVAGEVQAKAEHYVEQGREQIHELGETARDRVERARSGISQFVEENPLAAGALALAVGAAAGLAIPETRQERETMGPMRERLMERARETMSETRDKVERVADEAKRAAEEEARRQDLG